MVAALIAALVVLPLAAGHAQGQDTSAPSVPASPGSVPDLAPAQTLPPPQPEQSAPAAGAPSVTEAGPERATDAPALDPGSVPASEAETPAVQPSASGTLPHDLSPWGMFVQADIVVQAVMVGLAFASFVTWTVWLAKGLELTTAKRRAKRAVGLIESADSLHEAVRAFGDKRPRRGPVAALVRQAAHEVTRSASLPSEGVKERVAIALSRIEARAARSMTRGTGLLATIGATAPFVGLFGTVWGIMNSFIGISQSKTTNLAVVAPGIAEALLATGIGLVAAIPAVIIYNVFARSISGYRALLSDASAEVLQLVSRDLDRRDTQEAGPTAAVAPKAATRIQQG